MVDGGVLGEGFEGLERKRETEFIGQHCTAFHLAWGVFFPVFVQRFIIRRNRLMQTIIVRRKSFLPEIAQDVHPRN